MALKDLVIPTVDVQFAGGSFAVRGLSATDIELLLRKHGSEFKKVWDEFLTDKTDLTKLDSAQMLPMIQKVVASIPAAIVDLIALAADAEDDADMKQIRRMAVGLQCTAVASILSVTLNTDGDWAKTMETVLKLVSGADGALVEMIKAKGQNLG